MNSQENNMDVILNIEDLARQRDELLPTIISSFGIDQDTKKLFENVQLSVSFLRLYSISDVDESILHHLVPTIKNSLQKIYVDNVLLSDTSDGDFIVDILKENIQVASELLKSLKNIVQFILRYNNVSMQNIQSVPLNVGQSLFLTFEHCRNCQNIYKDNFNAELIQLFQLGQEVNVLFLKLFDSCVTGISQQDLMVLNEVLHIICNIGEILSGMNVKSMADNWKGFLTITQRFSNVLNDTINLQRPVEYLTIEINKNVLFLLENVETEQTIIPTVKIIGFMVKVVLKLLDSFWKYVENIYDTVMKFCCVIYSIKLNAIITEKYSRRVTDLLHNSLFKCTEPFLLRLINEVGFLMKLTVIDLDVNNLREPPLGFLCFLNYILDVISINGQKEPSSDNLLKIIKTIFNALEKYSTEMMSCSSSIFDELVVNTAAIILIFDDVQSDIEMVLMKNVLRNNFWCALFAIEVWCLLLRNSPPSCCLKTLRQIIVKIKRLDVGIFTHRPEKVYLKILLQRIFKSLPNNVKCDLATNLKPFDHVQAWILLELEHIPIQQRFLVENLVSCTVEKLSLFPNKCDLPEFLLIVENLFVISSLNSAAGGLNLEKLTSDVVKLWDFNVTDSLFHNNVFKYFLQSLSKITKLLVGDMNDLQFVLVLNQLTRLAVVNEYEYLVCDLLSSLTSDKRNTADCGQEHFKILALISNIIGACLLRNSSSVIRQNTLELIQQYAVSAKYDSIVKNVMKNSKDVQGEICNYLQRNVPGTMKNDENYFELIGNVRFQHKCIDWSRSEVSQVPYKKIKMDVEKVQSDLIDLKDDDDAAEVLSRIKTEMKCLTNVLKRDQLSRKNIADIKIIIGHLQSYL